MARTKKSEAAQPMDIRTRVAIWKAKTGGNHYELAQELHISPSFLSQILSGYRPGKDYVDRIEEYTKTA